MTATLSPAAMIVRAGMMHDEGERALDRVQMADLWRMLDTLPGGEAAIDAAWDELAGDPVSLPPAPAPAPVGRITWMLWIVFADGSRSILDIIDWEPGYNATARAAWRYMWGAFRAQMREPIALGGTSVEMTAQGR